MRNEILFRVNKYAQTKAERGSGEWYNDCATQLAYLHNTGAITTDERNEFLAACFDEHEWWQDSQKYTMNE